MGLAGDDLGGEFGGVGLDVPANLTDDGLSDLLQLFILLARLVRAGEDDVETPAAGGVDLYIPRLPPTAGGACCPRASLVCRESAPGCVARGGAEVDA